MRPSRILRSFRAVPLSRAHALISRHGPPNCRPRKMKTTKRIANQTRRSPTGNTCMCTASLGGTCFAHSCYTSSCKHHRYLSAHMHASARKLKRSKRFDAEKCTLTRTRATPDNCTQEIYTHTQPTGVWAAIDTTALHTDTKSTIKDAKRKRVVCKRVHKCAGRAGGGGHARTRKHNTTKQNKNTSKHTYLARGARAHGHGEGHDSHIIRARCGLRSGIRHSDGLRGLVQRLLLLLTRLRETRHNTHIAHKEIQRKVNHGNEEN